MSAHRDTSVSARLLRANGPELEVARFGTSLPSFSLVFSTLRVSEVWLKRIGTHETSPEHEQAFQGRYLFDRGQAQVTDQFDRRDIV